MKIPARLALVLLSTLTVACAADDVCQRAADHIDECLGMPAQPAATCSEAQAQSILDQSCDELVASQGKGDFLSFLCDVFGIFCPPYEPCGDKACGDTCTICDPADTDCAETQVVKMCDADGQCSASVPQCEAYEPCGGKSCGDACTVCDPADKGCFETAVLKECSAAGTCEAEIATCDTPICQPGTSGASCETFTCGGLFVRPCPSGSHCGEDTTDGCDPSTGGADCPGMCVCDDPTSCGIIQCGGFVNLACPDASQQCLDVPGDGCDPGAGGADCGGYCAG